MTTAKNVMKMIKDNDVKFVDFRFTDPRGKWQHVTFDITMIEEDTFAEGIMFDGSSIAGWKAINESDMILMPDPSSACMDPFAARPSMILFCDIIEPSTGQPYTRDPRGTAKKAEAYLKSTGIGDTALVGAEAEFFIFDSVKFGVGGNFAHHSLDSIEGPGANMKDYPEGNMGHRPVVKGGYFDGKPLTAEEVGKLADLESREVLLAKLAGAFKASLFGAAYLFNAPLSKAVRTVDALREKQESAA